MGRGKSWYQLVMQPAQKGKLGYWICERAEHGGLVAATVLLGCLLLCGLFSCVMGWVHLSMSSGERLILAGLTEKEG